MHIKHGNTACGEVLVALLPEAGVGGVSMGGGSGCGGGVSGPAGRKCPSSPRGIIWFVKHIGGIPIGSNDQVATTSEPTRAIRGPWVAGITNSASTESITSALPAASSKTPTMLQAPIQILRQLITLLSGGRRGNVGETRDPRSICADRCHVIIGQSNCACMPI